MVLGLADRIVDREVLHRLHIERDAVDRLGRCSQPTNDLADFGAALVVRLEIDQQAAAVERRIRAVDADERRQAFDIGILEDDLCQFALTFGHGRVGDRLRRFRNALDEAGVLHRKEAFRNEDIERHGQDQRGDRDPQRQSLPVENPTKQAAVGLDQLVEPLTAAALKSALVHVRDRPQELRTSHRHQGQRHHGRYQDGDR